MNRTDFLEAVKARVEQKTEYGEPEDCFKKIALLWSEYLDFGIADIDVVMMMILLKVARAGSEVTQDTLIDIAGYAACGEELRF